MRISFQLCTFLSLLLFVPQSYGLNCKALLNTQLLFEIDFQSELLRLPENHRLLLGKGLEGHVYVIAEDSSTTGKLREEKHFLIFETENPDIPLAIQNHNAIKKLKKFKEDDLLGGFKVIHVFGRRGHILDMKYDPGRIVRDVFRDENFPPHLKTKIINKYNRYLDRIALQWRNRGVKISFSNISGLRFLYIVSRNGREILTLDPYNILVNARNLDLVIFDPY